MAVYVPPGRRRLRLIAAVVAALVIGGVVGVVLGRGTAASIHDKVASTRSAAATAVAGLSVLPLEYGQAFAGEGGGATLQTVEQAGSSVTALLAGTPWLTDAQRARGSASVRAMTEAARRKARPAELEAAVRGAQKVLGDLFDVEVGAPIAPGGAP